MGEPEPSSSDSEQDVDHDAPPSPLSDDMNLNTHQPSFVARPAFNGIHHLVSYSFIISTTLDGLIHLFFPLCTTSENIAFTTLFRTTGIYSLTFSILSAGVIWSLNGHIDLLSIFLFALCFHCMTSLGNSAFSLISHGIRVIYAYEWLSMVFYISFLIALGRSQGTYMVKRVLTATGMKS